MSSILLQAPVHFSPLNSIPSDFPAKPASSISPPCLKVVAFDRKRLRLEPCRGTRGFLELGTCKDGIFVKDGRGRKNSDRVVLVRFNQGFGGGGGGSGGGGGDNGGTARILGNLALAIGLTYLSMTGQFGRVFDAVGWVLDAVISLWLIAVILPIVGVGAFLWWAGRDMLQSSCPTCGNEFQVFKSTLKDEPQMCPFCSQPFSVENDKFVRDSVKSSNESTFFGEAFSNFYSGSDKGGKDSSSSAVVDIEAEVKDAD
ncbi:unnamed protein product [Linum tenue]|uniref:Uncharacterized protein n=1 Tax=Linum tenue TaxID=586396 RepID=A0AAV0GS70_9ROSI|nr:unnamed protein product [Linum tenue]